MLLFARDADILFAVASSGRGGSGLRLVRRVLTFPSGFVGELDLNLFVGLGGGLGGGRFPVGGREDAEWDGDAGFKVQIDDLLPAREGSSPRPSEERKEDKKIPLASLGKEVEMKEEKKTADRGDASFLDSAFNRVPFAWVWFWTGGGEEERFRGTGKFVVRSEWRRRKGKGERGEIGSAGGGCR
ncbi:hypothetical protein VTK73DRAFT_8702 [Phialemonium thermophilum]|uniref:Uncharacterized protein n=1 Tax=Phialemonium thermophilum TaxID=223376 RepID=A0ABR3W6X7_9PEZI